ncbi:MAG: YabP/YqfC family sporulation protein [Alicyclobacillus herbarius]|uniref:YabP/YqfC family sporulation protein n=1 Tax=Alicyclobacillus herbarius TaxID=122960 RepID=UPI00040AC581|nr:YabP/YqfC family sporulation protein [Alicyclobacillus herbarius]MCL6631085.1 YabP/YqfC family sporulation protein [Alicyclobacillus herbarius]
MRNLRKAWKQKASQWLSLPPDMVTGVARVLILADQQVVMENIVGLERVGETEIVVDIGHAHIRLTGTGFEVTFAASGEIHIQGRVDHIEFVRGQESWR